MQSIRVEPMRVDDVEAALEIEQASFTSPWSRVAFLHELRKNRVARLWVARPESAEAPTPSIAEHAVLGYVCLWTVLDELHITNLAVHPAWRRQGIARQLLGTLLAHYQAQGASRALLEVRPANQEARRLYESFGFRAIGVRKGYYFDTGEDALLLEAGLGVRNPVVR